MGWMDDREAIFIDRFSPGRVGRATVDAYRDVDTANLAPVRCWVPGATVRGATGGSGWVLGGGSRTLGGCPGRTLGGCAGRWLIGGSVYFRALAALRGGECCAR